MESITTRLHQALLSLVLLFGLPICLAQAPEPDFSSVPAPDMKKDLQLLRTILNESHPGFYRYTSKERFDFLFDSIADTFADTMSQQDFYVAVTPIIAAIKDGHIKYMPQKRKHWQYYYNLEALFPLEMHVTPSEIAMVKDLSGSGLIPVGSQILSINGTSTTDLLAKMLPLVFFADGNSMAVKYQSLSKFFAFYYGTYVGSDNAYSIKFRHDGVEKTVSIPAIRLEVLEKREKETAHETRLPMRMTYQDEKTALLSIDNFNFDKKTLDIKDFLKKNFAELKSKNIQNLIIDLRGNEGGTDVYGNLLYSYLAKDRYRYYERIKVAQKKRFSFEENIVWIPGIFPIYRKLFVHADGSGGFVFRKGKPLEWQKPAKDAFQGNVYILIDGYSFSVTSEFASIAHHNQRATFIGRETGGGYLGNTSGFFVVSVLPNSGVEIATPQWDYWMSVENPIKDRGIIPDIEIWPTVGDVLEGRDLEMERVMGVIGE